METSLQLEPGSVVILPDEGTLISSPGKKGGKFEIFKSEGLYKDQYYWHLKSKNGKIIAQSEGYNSKQAAEKGIKSVHKYAINAEVTG